MSQESITARFQQLVDAHSDRSDINKLIEELSKQAPGHVILRQVIEALCFVGLPYYADRAYEFFADNSTEDLGAFYGPDNSSEVS